MPEVKITVEAARGTVTMQLFTLRGQALIDMMREPSQEAMVFRTFAGHADVWEVADHLSSIELYAAFRAWVFGEPPHPQGYTYRPRVTVEPVNYCPCGDPTCPAEETHE